MDYGALDFSAPQSGEELGAIRFGVKRSFQGKLPRFL